MAVKLVRFVLVGSLYLFAGYFLYQTSPLLSLLVILVALMHLTLRGLRPVMAKTLRKRRIRNSINGDISGHLKVLARKREDLVWTDDYGLVHYEDWDREKEYFINKVIGAHLPDLHEEDFLVPFLKIDAMIDERIDGFIREGLLHGPVREYREENWDEAGQQDYRKYCERLLCLSGWKVVPREENDGPARPIVAEKEGRTCILSCIKASSPVGRKRIRHTFRLKKDCNADLGAVVTNAGYSRWAKWASSRYKVLALHHQDLSSLE